MKEKVVDINEKIAQKKNILSFKKGINHSFFEIQKLFSPDVFCSVFIKDEEFLVTKKEFDDDINADFSGKVGYIIGPNRIFERIYTSNTSQKPTQDLNLPKLINRLKLFGEKEGFFIIDNETVLIREQKNFSDWHPSLFCAFDERIIRAESKISKY